MEGIVILLDLVSEYQWAWPRSTFERYVDPRQKLSSRTDKSNFFV